ncbi:hypothetical protein VINE108274_05710 [Vibrio neptunius]
MTAEIVKRTGTSNTLNRKNRVNGTVTLKTRDTNGTVTLKSLPNTGLVWAPSNPDRPCCSAKDTPYTQSFRVAKPQLIELLT